MRKKRKIFLNDLDPLEEVINK